MTISELLRNASEKEDAVGADVIAAIMNADTLARQNLSGRQVVTGADVMRLGKVLALYSDMRPAGEGSEAFRKPSNVRPAAPGSAASEQAAA
jgi:hypothetical protein